MTDIIQSLQKDSAKSMYQKHGIKYLGLFGSVARNEETVGSDVDLLIDFYKSKSLFDLADVKLYFEDILGRRVDLAMRGRVKKILDPYVNQDLITIYEKN